MNNSCEKFLLIGLQFFGEKLIYCGGETRNEILHPSEGRVIRFQRGVHPRAERRERERERERRRGRMKGQKARGKGRKREKERERDGEGGKRESLFARLYFCETYSSLRHKGCTFAIFVLAFARGSRLETKSRESSLDFRRNQFSLCLCACRVRASRPPSLCAPICACMRRCT